MSFSSNIYLPPPSPAQLARLAKEREELEDLFGDFGDDDDGGDTTSHTNAYSRVMSFDNASNTVVNSGTRTNQGGPLVNYNNSPLNLQNTNISTFNSAAGDTRSNYQSHASGSRTNNLYNLQTIPNENTFQTGTGGYYQKDVVGQMATDNHMWQNYQQQQQQHNGGMAGVNRLSQHTLQPMSSQVGGYVQNGVNMPLPATQTQTQIQTPLPSQGYMPNHSTISQNSQPTPNRQEYIGPIPNAPASIFTPDPHRTPPAIQTQTQTQIQTPLPSQEYMLNHSTTPQNNQFQHPGYTGPIPNAPASTFIPYRTLPAIQTQTQTQIQTPLPSQKDMLNHSTAPQNNQFQHQGYIGPIPNAPASAFIPYRTLPAIQTQTQIQIQTPLPPQKDMSNHSTAPQNNQFQHQGYIGPIPNAPASAFNPNRTLPAIQTQTQIQTPLPPQKDTLNHSTIPKNSQSKHQGYSGPIPNGPASVFTPYSDDADENDFGTMTTSPGVRLVNGRLVSYDRFMGQTHDVTIPDPVSLQDGAISLEGMAAAAYYFHKDQLHYNDAVRFLYNLNLQPEFVEGNSQGDSSPVLPERLDHSSPHINIGASEMFQGAIHLKNIPNPPPVTSDGQPIPSTSFNNIPPTQSKRQREEDVDTSPPILSAPPRKRRCRRSAQSHTPSLSANTQTTPLPVFSGMNLQQRKTVPPYVALGPEVYMCNYLGPAVPNDHRICGSLVKSSTRNRDRHMGNHAEDEEGLISSGAISRDAVHALLWVQPRVFTCAISGCNYSLSVWRMDGVRRKHEEEHHPELVQSKKGKGKARD